MCRTQRLNFSSLCHSTTNLFPSFGKASDLMLSLWSNAHWTHPSLGSAGVSVVSSKQTELVLGYPAGCQPEFRALRNIQEKEQILRKLKHDTLEAKLSQHVVKHSINYNQHYIRCANIIRSVHFLNTVNGGWLPRCCYPVMRSYSGFL